MPLRVVPGARVTIQTVAFRSGAPGQFVTRMRPQESRPPAGTGGVGSPPLGLVVGHGMPCTLTTEPAGRAARAAGALAASKRSRNAEVKRGMVFSPFCGWSSL